MIILLSYSTLNEIHIVEPAVLAGHFMMSNTSYMLSYQTVLAAQWLEHPSGVTNEVVDSFPT